MPTYRTETGKVLTDEDIEALADEAERGYDIGRLMQTLTPQAQMTNLVSHVIHDRGQFGRERGHVPGRPVYQPAAEGYAKVQSTCERCVATITVIAMSGQTLIITDEMVVRDCAVEGHKLGESGTGTAEASPV